VMVKNRDEKKKSGGALKRDCLKRESKGGLLRSLKFAGGGKSLKMI